MKYTFDVSLDERQRLRVLAAADGLSCAEYVRRRLFGGVNDVLVPKVDLPKFTIKAEGTVGDPPDDARIVVSDGGASVDARDVLRKELGLTPLVATSTEGVAAQLAARGIDVPNVVVSRPKVKEPVKMHKHQASGNGPVPVCECGAVRSSDGFWHVVPS